MIIIKRLMGKKMALKNKIINSFYLFSRPSFFEGIARIFDWSGSLNAYWDSVTNEDADCLAVKKDWRAVGGDFKTAIDLYGKQFVSK